jgi:hypothetical protein
MTDAQVIRGRRMSNRGFLDYGLGSNYGMTDYHPTLKRDRQRANAIFPLAL